LENFELFGDGGEYLGEVDVARIVDDIDEINLDRLAQGRVNQQINK
jgi:hypothetical protein